MPEPRRPIRLIRMSDIPEYRTPGGAPVGPTHPDARLVGLPGPPVPEDSRSPGGRPIPTSTAQEATK